MGNPLSDVPWGNLWRWIVSSLFFFTVIGMPIAILTDLDRGFSAGIFQSVVAVLSAFIAAIVVWSDDIPWPGDP